MRCDVKILSQLMFVRLFVVVYLTLTDPLRIQPWFQDNGTKRNKTRNTFGEKKCRENRQQSSQQRTSSPGFLVL